MNRDHVVYSLDSDEAQEFCHFLVISGHNMNISAGDNGDYALYAMTITDSYGAEMFYFTSKTTITFDMLIRECINSYIATYDGKEMYEIWLSQ